MKTQNTLHLAGLLLILWSIATFSCVFALDADAQTVHALLVLMDNDRKISGIVEISAENMRDMLRRLPDTQLEMKTLKASGDEGVTSWRILGWVQELRVDPQDTILVYYNGHGYVDDKNGHHHLQLDEQIRDRDLPRATLTGALRAKSCRLRMLITDTCSQSISDLASSDATISGLGKVVPTEEKRKQQYVKDLFLQHEGFLDITAASPEKEQIALGTGGGPGGLGGFFTHALTKRSLTETVALADGDEFLLWGEVFAKCQIETQDLFLQYEEPARVARLISDQQTTQMPYAYLPLPTKIDMEKRPVQKPGKTATLSITSTPSGGTVYLEGEKVGTTPLPGYKVSLGTRDRRTVRVTIGQKGDAVYFPRPKDLKLTQNQHASEHFQEEAQHQDRARQQVDLSKMVLIPAGEFPMGTDGLAGESGENSKPIHSVSLDAFYIDTHEVTVGEYKRFIEAARYKPLLKDVKKFSPTDMHPVVGVSWRDAMAYATWAGKRLPTEAEWEKAARGGLLDKKFPWGDEKPNSALANYQKMEKTTTPVGEYPPNGFGLYDVAGNVSEWCLDEWDADFYTPFPEENPFAGPKSRDATLEEFQTLKGLRVVRGGSWSAMSPGSLYVGGRTKAEALKVYNYIGFRCAKDASP